METVKKMHIGLLIGLIAAAAIVFLLLASLIEDTGFPGGMAESSRNLIYAITAFILSLTGWAVVWRREMYVTDLQKVVRGKWAVVTGVIVGLLFSVAGIWFLGQMLI
jgi:hypothetical protein